MGEKFFKMHGLGNDFVVLDRREKPSLPSEAQRIRLSDRKRGIGCDQLIILMPPEDKGATLFMRIYNPDGSEAGACGNATRCVARLIFQETGNTEAVIQTVAGLLPVRLAAEGIYEVNFGEPRLNWDKIPMAVEADTLMVETSVDGLPPACCVNVGNPHAIFFVPQIDQIDLEKTGPKVERHALFPDRINVEFAEVVDRQTIRMRVWERGAGVTQACGSGACATAVAAVRRKLVDRKVAVVLDGGTLMIEWREDNNRIMMSGSATLAYAGVIEDELYA